MPAGEETCAPALAEGARMESEPGILEFTAYDIGTEGWLVSNLKCACGGSWGRSGGQRLVEMEGKPCDELDATCDACGTSVTCPLRRVRLLRPQGEDGRVDRDDAARRR